MKLKYRGVAGQFGKVKTMGLLVEKNEIYDVPDSLAVVLLKKKPNEWKLVDYVGNAKRVPIDSKRLVETLSDNKMLDQYRAENKLAELENKKANEELHMALSGKTIEEGLEEEKKDIYFWACPVCGNRKKTSTKKAPKCKPCDKKMKTNFVEETS